LGEQVLLDVAGDEMQRLEAHRPSGQERGELDTDVGLNTTREERVEIVAGDGGELRGRAQVKLSADVGVDVLGDELLERVLGSEVARLEGRVAFLDADARAETTLRLESR